MSSSNRPQRPNPPQRPNKPQGSNQSAKQNQSESSKTLEKQKREDRKPQKREDRKPLLPRLENSAEVPVMFRAQIQDAHGSLQFAGKVKGLAGDEKQTDIANEWVEEWLKPWQPSTSSPSKVTKEAAQSKTPLALALQRAQPKPSSSAYELKMPTWGVHIHSWKYQISWRLVTNSGQEPDLIRPILGARGVPFYPGSSMKGAFAQACTDDTPRSKYCGSKPKPENKGETTKPGCLRFHGGYPVDATWANPKILVDVIHPQQDRQIETEGTTSAKKQISLFETVICFGFSSTDPNTDWDEVRGIWEKALMKGLGGRTSAGYGQLPYRIEGKRKVLITETREPLLSVYLSGQGITSQLLNKQPEFRPNMFKAALRGHTLRLFAGIADGNIAKQATFQLWGGIREKAGNTQDAATVGQLGVQFIATADQLKSHIEHKYRYYDEKAKQERTTKMFRYELTIGQLNIFHQDTKNPIPLTELIALVKSLIQFTLLLSGFGKSWRRVDHKTFPLPPHLPDYFANGDKPTIGCHWKFGQDSYSLYLDTSDWKTTIPAFLTDLHRQFHDWLIKLIKQRLSTNGYEKTWREAWHPDNVQVWGRLAENEKDSLAISWFHGDYTSGQTIKGTFAGKIGKIGRVWHRMYPQYIQMNGEWEATGKYVELLTIFPRFQKPNDPDKIVADKFVRFLQNNQDFTKLWGN